MYRGWSPLDGSPTVCAFGAVMMKWLNRGKLPFQRMTSSAAIKKLDSRGVAALEFCFVAVAFFALMFAIFDLGRYAITMQSLRALANAGAREMMINCYTPSVINNQPLTNCLVDPLPPDPAKQAVAPFLYAGGLKPDLTVTPSTNIPPPPAK